MVTGSERITAIFCKHSTIHAFCFLACVPMFSFSLLPPSLHVFFSSLIIFILQGLIISPHWNLLYLLQLEGPSVFPLHLAALLHVLVCMDCDLFYHACSWAQSHVIFSRARTTSCVLWAPNTKSVLTHSRYSTNASGIIFSSHIWFCLKVQLQICSILLCCRF